MNPYLKVAIDDLTTAIKDLCFGDQITYMIGNEAVRTLINCWNDAAEASKEEKAVVIETHKELDNWRKVRDTYFPC